MKIKDNNNQLTLQSKIPIWFVENSLKRIRWKYSSSIYESVDDRGLS